MEKEFVRQVRLAMAVCLGGVALFSIMDAVVKAASLMIGVYNVLLWRSLTGAVLGGVLMLGRGAAWPRLASMRLHVLRGIVAAAMTYSFFWALVRLPLAEAIALSFIAPLVALYLAAIFLHERVERSAILASVLGLAGVGVIVSARVQGHHGDDALWGVAAALISALLYAGNLVIQRRQAQIADPIEIATFQNIVIGVVFGTVAPWFAEVPHRDVAPLIVISALLAFTSLAVIAWAYARVEAQKLIPLEYTAFLWSAVVGWLAFDEKVTGAMLAGAALIVAGAIIVARSSQTPAHIESSSA